MNAKLIVVLLPLTMLMACTVPQRAVTPEGVANNVTASTSEFDKGIHFNGPELHGPIRFGEPTYVFRLAAAKDKATGEITYILRVKWRYLERNWRFFKDPTLPGGTVLGASIKRHVLSCGSGSCKYLEVLASALPQELLRNAENGLRVRYSSDLGAEVVEIPQAYIAGFLQGLDGKL